MKKNNIFLIIAILFTTLLTSILISISSSQTISQEEQDANIEIPVQQSIPISVEVIKTNVNNMEDGTITSKIRFSGNVSGGVYISLLDKNEDPVPGQFQQQAFILNEGTYIHDNFIVSEGIYKLKITNGTDEFITSEIIIRGKNEIDAPTFNEKPSIKVVKPNTLEASTNQLHDDAEIYTSTTLSWDRDVVSINCVDVILHDETNNSQTIVAEQNIDNFSFTFKDLAPSKYSTEFVVNYTNIESGIVKESYSNSSFLVQSYEEIANPDAPIAANVKHNIIEFNDYSNDLIKSEVEVSVSIFETQLPMSNVSFTIGGQTVQSDPSIEDPNDPTRTLYQATFSGIADGTHTYSVNGSYPGGTIFSEGKFDMYSENTPNSSVIQEELIVIHSMPGKASGKIEVWLEISTYSSIQNIKENSELTLTNNNTLDQISGKPVLIKQESGTLDKEIIKYVKLSFDGLEPGYYNLKYNGKFNDATYTFDYTKNNIQVEEFGVDGVDVPIYKDVEINSVNNTWNEVNGKIVTKISLDEVYTEDYSIKTEYRNISNSTNDAVVENTTGHNSSMEKIIGDLETGDYSVAVYISKGINEPEVSSNWKLISKEYLTLTEDARLKPSINTITYDLIKSDYLADNGGVENIEVIFTDTDYFIDEVYFEIKSGDSLIRSEQAEEVDNIWLLPEGIIFTDLQPLNYTLSIKTILLDSSSMETPYLFNIDEKPNPESMTDFKILWILIGVGSGLLLIGGALGYYFVRIK